MLARPKLDSIRYNRQDAGRIIIGLTLTVTPLVDTELLAG